MKPTRITPGTLCWLVRCDYEPSWVGRVVTAVRFVESRRVIHQGRQFFIQAVWELSAPWMPPGPFGLKWSAPASYLRPIIDPDADLSEPAADPMHEDLVDRLRFTRPEIA